MSASQPPTENLPAFNSSVFKDANTESLSLSKAKSLFLGRTGTPNSTASGTTFTGALNVNGTTTTQGLTVNSGTIGMVNGSIVVNGNTGVRIVGIASQNTGSQNNISIGHNSSSSGVYDVSVGNYANCQTGTSYSTAIGYSAIVNSSLSYATAVGSNASCSATNSTAVGASSQAQAFGSTAIGSGAVATLANQIMLGTATETVYFPGSASLKSLDASANILVAGIGIGIGSNAIGAANIFIGKGTAGVGAGSNNTIIGRNNYGATSTAGTANTFLGASGGQYISGIINNATVIGANTYLSTTSYDGITALGAGCGVAGINATAVGYGSQANAAGSTAIGYNAVATLANSIVLGTSSNTVYCHGTSTTNGALQLAGGLVLQSTYGTIASNMIGYTISPAKTTANPLLATNGTVSNLYSFTVPLGVWLLIYQVYFTSTNTLTVTFVNSTMALTSTGSNGFQTTSGQMVRNATETFNNVAQSQSGSSCVIVNTTAPFTLYYNVGAIYSGIGSLTAAGSYSLTRIA